MKLESREAIEALKSYETKNLAEELVVELLLTPSSDGDGLATMADKIVDSDLSTEEVENLHLVVMRIRKEVGIDPEDGEEGEEGELPRMFMAYHDYGKVINIDIFWKDLTPEKRLEIGQQIANADAHGVDSDEVYELSEEEKAEILSDSYENWDVIPMASFDIEFDDRETADLEEE